MSPRKEVFQAVVYDPSSDTTEPFIQHDHHLNERVFGRFKVASMILGLFIGFFIQFSTLGANFLVITIWGEDVITKSKRDIVMFSLLWSFFTSAMAIVILGFLRNLVTISYNAIRRESEDLLEDMILHMECRFVVGALIGVCLAWTMTDILLGMKAQILYSLITLVVALFWCRVMMWCFASEKSEKKSIEEPLLIV